MSAVGSVKHDFDVVHLEIIDGIRDERFDADELRLSRVLTVSGTTYQHDQVRDHAVN